MNVTEDSDMKLVKPTCYTGVGEFISTVVGVSENDVNVREGRELATEGWLSLKLCYKINNALYRQSHQEASI